MRSHRGCKVAKKIYPTPTHYETGCVFNQKAQFYKILLDTAKVVTVKMHDSSQSSLSILISAFILVFEVWMVVKEFSDFGMACFNELIIGISQGFAFHLKIITEMVENDVNF